MTAMESEPKVLVEGSELCSTVWTTAQKKRQRMEMEPRMTKGQIQAERGLRGWRPG